MLWEKRMYAALIALAVSAALCVVIVRVSPEKPRFTPGQVDSGITYEATGVASDEIVADVDGNGASAEMLTYEIGYSCSYLDMMLGMYGKELDMDEVLSNGMAARDYIREESLQMLKKQLVLENLCERYGVTLSEADEAEIGQRREQNIAALGEEGYREELYKTGLSEEGYERVVLRAGYLYRALCDAYLTPGSALYADDDVLHAYAAGAGYITADHILLMTVDSQTREPLSEEARAEKRQLAEDILWQLRDSADPISLFDELAAQYGEDLGRETYPHGYTFRQGMMVEAFDAAARALEENEYSELVETEYGYHIILRRPLDVAAAVEAVRDEYFEVFFLAELDKAEMTVSPAADRFDPAAIYAALRAAQGAAEDTPQDEG